MDWQIIFELSKVNGGMYFGDELPRQNWEWPTETWFQKHLRDVRKKEKQWMQKINRRNLVTALSEGEY